MRRSRKDWIIADYADYGTSSFARGGARKKMERRWIYATKNFQENFAPCVKMTISIDDDQAPVQRSIRYQQRNTNCHASAKNLGTAD